MKTDKTKTAYTTKSGIMKFHEWWVSRDRHWMGNGDESLRLVANAAWDAAQQAKEAQNSTDTQQTHTAICNQPDSHITCDSRSKVCEHECDDCEYQQQ